MLQFLTLLLLVSQAADDPSTKGKTPRKASAIAPSLPELTDAEEAEFDRVIDRFIEFDSGGRKDPDGKQILADFQKLGNEAIPALIRGINRAAKIDHSCPAVIIAKKLERMLLGTHDPELLEFARENIGAGVERSLHMGVLKKLRVVCIFRKSQLARAGELDGGMTALAGPKRDGKNGSGNPWKKLTTTELVEAAGKERGEKLNQILTELGQRRGDRVIATLGTAAASYEKDVQKHARDLLDRQMNGLSADQLKEKLKDDRAEVRLAVIRAAGRKKIRIEAELVDLLIDDSQTVREAAHQALLKASGGKEQGPASLTEDDDARAAQKSWRTWLAQRGTR